MSSQYPYISIEPDTDSGFKPDADHAQDKIRFDSMPPNASHPGPSYFSQTYTPLSIGDVLKDRFVLVAALGEGGMGMVFKALDKRKEEAEDSNPFVAVKVLRPEMAADPNLFIALHRETKRAQQLSHPNIIQVYDFDRDDKQVFMSMEYLTGQTLSKFIKSSAPVSLANAWTIIEGMALALACAHQHNIVHSDFKPGNVFIKDNGTVKVLDFGIASKFNSQDHEDEEKTRYNPRCLGAYTEAYASLEMLNGINSPDPRDDIYALGCVIYKLLTGKHPYSMLSAKQVAEFNKDPQNKNRKLTPAAIPGLSHRQMSALFKSLQLERHLRTKSIAELLENLRAVPYPHTRHISLGLTLFAALSLLFWIYRFAFLPQEAIPDKMPGAGNYPTDLPATRQPVAQPAGHIEPKAKPAAGHIATSADGLVKLWSLKPAYKIGQSLQINFTVSKPVYVRLVHRGAKGEVSDLLPNPFQPAKLIKPGNEYSVPPIGANFTINVEGPVGKDTVTILASEQPISPKLKILMPDGSIIEQLKPPPYSWCQISYLVSPR